MADKTKRERATSSPPSDETAGDHSPDPSFDRDPVSRLDLQVGQRTGR
jgi:hypothetical protein